MNNDTQLLHKTSENQIKQHIKGLYFMTNWDLFQEWKGGSTMKTNQCDISHNRKRGGEEIILIDAEKAFDTMQELFMI